MISKFPDEIELQKLREKPLAPGGLWVELLQIAGSSEAELAAWLQQKYGIEVIPDERLSEVTVIPEASSAGTQGQVWVVSAGKPLLLCVDPWDTVATTTVSRRSHALLALSRPGQLQRLHTMGNAGQGLDSSPTPASSNAQDSDVVHFVDAAIARAYEDGASDIHFETDRSGIAIKYRLDGVMALGEKFPHGRRSEEIISRIKVMAQLDITERRRPQDGRIHWSLDSQTSIDLRVSIMPSIFGEDAVLRLLDKSQLKQADAHMSLDALGFDSSIAKTVRDLAARPHGMLLITGPTGSGKTTTVYASLSEINNGLEKIITIEDPVEYELPGVLQIPVNEQKGLTFATGLRSILRHDPDKILVGEIRDAETAEIAVQSALTGHLVLTTVHANSLFDVLGRFQHFDIDPFGLASAINGIVVQRLLRKICTQCSDWRDLSEEESRKLKALNLPLPARVPLACGCKHCRQTGYKGRFVVAEVHEFDDELRDLIVKRPSMTELKRLVHSNGSDRLLSRTIEKVAEGVTTLEEIVRVVGLV